MRKSVLVCLVGLGSCFSWLCSAYGADRGPLNPGETKTGQLSSPGFADTWTFSGEAGDRVVVTTGMISGYVSPQIFLYPPDSGTVETSSEGVSYDHRLDHPLQQSGLYTIVIKEYGSNDTGEYGIALAKIPGPCTSSIDPDGGAIAVSSTMTGTLSHHADTDMYQFDGTAGDRVIITTGMTSGYVSPEIFLYPPDSGPVEVSSTGVSYDHRLDHPLQQSGLYTILIEDYASNDEGEYSIALTKIPGPGTSSSDPDGGAIAVASTMTGTLSGRADTDIYQFYGTVGDRVVITTGMISGYVSPEIFLYPPDSGPIEASLTGVSYDHRLDHPLQQSGLYTILIEDYGSNDEGGYSIALAKIPGPGTSPTDPDGGCPITSGANMTGTLSGRADTDMYQFHGRIGERVIITTAEVSGYVSPEIFLYPPDSGEIEDSSTGVSYEHSIDHPLEQSGLYTILIEDYGSNDEGEYGMSLIKIPATESPGMYSPSPSNGSSISNLNGSFSWDAVTGATGYDLYFGENVTTALQKIGTNLTSPTMAFPTMHWKKVYYWHVVAHTATGDIQGPYWWFKTEPVPAAYLLWTK